MKDREREWDKLLQIATSGRDDSSADAYRYPYEPTPYCVLERLAKSGLVKKGDMLLDYGCGKGRADFFLAYQTGAHTVGVEYDERIYKRAMENEKSALSKARVRFVHTTAESYQPSKEVNRCYFFNPFSVKILQKAMAKMLASYYESPREILLFFYYPSDEYLAYLMTVSELDFYGEIDCADLFEGADKRERILIFSLPGY